MNNEEKILQALLQNDEKIFEILAQMQTRLDRVEDAVAGVRLLVDVDIDRKLNLLAEGQQAILSGLKTKTPIERTEKIEERQEAMTYVVRSLSAKVDDLMSAQ